MMRSRVVETVLYNKRKSLVKKNRLMGLSFILLMYQVLASHFAIAVPENLLPIEVFSANNEKVQSSFSFQLNNPAVIDLIEVQCHRCGFYNGALRRSADGYNQSAKVSLRVNSGPWIAVTDEQVELDAKTKAYGGINGALYTITFGLTLDEQTPLHTGVNTVTFRFNGTDGISNGFRILNVGLISEGVNVLSSAHYTREDPRQWSPLMTSKRNIRQGSNLWFNAELVNDPVTKRNLIAACADCHESSGRDLKYFNYSDQSIIKRAQFHGLSAKQGRKIASYIRNLSQQGSQYARPWHPPYQPKPQIDNRAVTHWAAGGGLEAVLRNDAQMLNRLFPNGTSPTQIRRVIRPGTTLNVRELPVAIQFPDWNAWLPEMHPLDIWGNNWSNGIDSSSPQEAYENVIDQLQNRRNFYLQRPGQMIALISSIDDHVRGYISEGNTDKSLGNSPWRSLNSIAINQARRNLANQFQGIPNNLRTRVIREHSKVNLARWSAVKQWEVHRRFNLENVSTTVFGNDGEARAWISLGQNTHPIAPHITTDNRLNFAYQEEVVGVYQSTAWYQLQMVLNASQKQPANVKPVDWPYQLIHVRKLGEYSGIHEPLRFISSYLKALQQRNNGEGPAFTGWQLRITHPWWLYSDPFGNTEHMRALEAVEPDLRNKVMAAFINALMQVHESFRNNQWELCSSPTNPSLWHCIQSPYYVPKLSPSKGKFIQYPSPNHADNYYRLIPCLYEQGVSEQAIQRMINWSDSIWPDGVSGNDWHNVKAQGCPSRASP